MLGYVYGQTAGWMTFTRYATYQSRSDLSTNYFSVYPDLANRLSRKQDFAIKVAAPIGSLFGQLLFGWLADIVGRKRMCK